MAALIDIKRYLEFGNGKKVDVKELSELKASCTPEELEKLGEEAAIALKEEQLKSNDKQ